jgi:hypothetical protein
MPALIYRKRYEFGGRSLIFRTQVTAAPGGVVQEGTVCVPKTSSAMISVLPGKLLRPNQVEVALRPE